MSDTDEAIDILLDAFIDIVQRQSNPQNIPKELIRYWNVVKTRRLSDERLRDWRVFVNRVQSLPKARELAAEWSRKGAPGSWQNADGSSKGSAAQPPPPPPQEPKRPPSVIRQREYREPNPPPPTSFASGTDSSSSSTSSVDSDWTIDSITTRIEQLRPVARTGDRRARDELYDLQTKLQRLRIQNRAVLSDEDRKFYNDLWPKIQSNAVVGRELFDRFYDIEAAADQLGLKYPLALSSTSSIPAQQQQPDAVQTVQKLDENLDPGLVNPISYELLKRTYDEIKSGAPNTQSSSQFRRGLRSRRSVLQARVSELAQKAEEEEEESGAGVNEAEEQESGVAALWDMPETQQFIDAAFQAVGVNEDVVARGKEQLDKLIHNTTPTKRDKEKVRRFLDSAMSRIRTTNGDIPDSVLRVRRLFEK